MLTLQQVQRAIKRFKCVDQQIDLDGDDGDGGFLLVLNDRWNWEYGDPGCHTRGWRWDDGTTIDDIKDDLRGVVKCDGSCGSENCQ